MKYLIEYCNIPTRINPTRTIETDNLELFVHVTGDNRLYFTDYAKRLNDINENSAIIERIYQDNKEKNELNVLYKRGKHFSTKLSDMVKSAPTEIFV
jgi:hypothetical protein